ncbi:integrase [Mangrovimonas yunxiaonensis]|uniref:Integrase n=1 Tax=Mangrovimonas yunxiaonensis TaxID=1197477 RepID=A0A084TKB1_9FLAO|nr:site-specific integrase [Mangrovimonas yunxiaonensis]KFB01147.1 integrase [Mangrovimonas yunxiaonensis]GGH38384.1 transposase [Mangrovimonas yunxiaonensis]
MKINILFVINKHKANAKGLCSLMCRLTFNKKRKVFSTGQFVNPSYWNSKKQQVKPQAPNRDEINTQLSLIKTQINRAFLMLQVQEYSFTVDDVYRLYKGEKLEKEYNVVEYFEVHLNKLKTLVGKDVKQVTWNKYSYVKMDIKSFIRWKYKANDIPLKKLEPNFLTELEYYFKVVKEIKQITINKKIQRFRKIVKVSVSEGYLEKDPFMLYKAKKVRNEIVYLTAEELQDFEKHQFIQPRLQLIQDLFVFSCYTGLPYRELMNMRTEHIIYGFDGNKWIQMKREKTGQIFSVPLLPKPIDIIKKYNNKDVRIFPKISNQKYNSYLKEIAAIIGIEKRLTTHVARKTFASTVLLYNDVPMEVVSRLLGHSKIQTTQGYYGKIVEAKISDEMIKLKSKLKAK